MLERLAGLEEEYTRLTERMNDPAVLTDQRALRETGRRIKELEPIVRGLLDGQALDDLATAKEMLPTRAATTATWCGPRSTTRRRRSRV